MSMLGLDGTATPPHKAIAVLRDFPLPRPVPAPLRWNAAARTWWDHRTWFERYEANPRSSSAMLAIAAAAIGGAFAGLVPDIAAPFPIDPAVAAGFGAVVAPPDDSAGLAAWVAANGYDTVLLLYPDAIGQGWGAVESALIALPGVRLWVINGRRRMFRLDPAIRCGLRLRRWLSTWRLAEIGFALAIVPLALTLAAADAARGRR